MAVVVPIVSKFDDSGIKKLKSGFKGLKSAVGGALAIVGLQASIKGLYDAAKAASEDNKAQLLLETGLKRSSKATLAQIKASAGFIDKLSLQTGVIDDKLRPALANLARATNDVDKAQQLLQISLDASTMKGVDVDRVQMAIAKAYSGNTSALKRMFPELNKVALQYEKQNGKVKTLAQSTDLGRKMIAALAKESKGLAAQQADPFEKLNIGLDQLKESLGRVILPAFEGFVSYLQNSVLPKVDKFFQSLDNPATNVGKEFKILKDDIKSATKSVKDFFGAFDAKGDSMTGLIKFVDLLVKIGPLLVGLAILGKVAKWMKEIAGLVKAVMPFFAGIGGLFTGGAIGAGVGGYQSSMNQKTERDAWGSLINKGSTVTINVNGVVGDKASVGKAVKEAITAYDKQNGRVGRQLG